MMTYACCWIGSSGSKPTCSRNKRVPWPSGFRVQVTVVSRRPPRHAMRSSRSGSRSSTWQCTIPSKPCCGRGSVRKVKRCPTTGSKSFGMSHRAIRPASVSACHTFAGEWARYWSTMIAAGSVMLLFLGFGIEQVAQVGELRAPELLVRRQPRRDLHQWIGTQLVEPLAPRLLLGHQAGVLEHFQMLGHAGPAHREVV